MFRAGSSASCGSPDTTSVRLTNKPSTKMAGKLQATNTAFCTSMQEARQSVVSGLQQVQRSTTRWEECLSSVIEQEVPTRKRRARVLKQD